MPIGRQTKVRFRARWRGALAVAAAAAALHAGGGAAEAARILIDFGAGGTQTTTGASPDDPVNAWNNVPDTIATSTLGSVSDLRYTTNAPSGFGLTVTSRFNASNPNGTTDSTVYADDATRDQLYGNTASFGGLSNLTPTFKLTGLPLDYTFDFTFYASRIDSGATDNREALYTVTGSNTKTAELNALNNVNGTATVTGISPSPQGEIQIALSPGNDNTHNNRFVYIGVLDVNVVPEPGGAALVLGGGLAALLRRRRR